MKSCPKCQKEIDSKASKCPHCQSDLRPWPLRHPFWTIIIVLVVIGLFNKGNKKDVDDSMPKVSTGSVATPTPSPVKTEFAVGEAIKMSDYQLTVNKVSKASRVSYSTPKSGNEYVMVNLTLQNLGDKEVSYNPFDFKLQDSNGNQTTTDYVSLDDQLNSGSLAAGGKVTGSISFQAPKGDANLMLIYQPNYFIDKQRITVKLQ